MKKSQEKKISMIIISLFAILIVFIATMVIYQKIKYSKINFNYNGIEVRKVEDENGIFYEMKIFINNNPQPFLINFRNDPRELESITIESNLKDKIIKKELYITMDKEASSRTVIAATEISKITGNKYLFNLPTHGAFTSQPEGKGWPIKTCADVINETSIIYLNINNQTRIYSRDGCVLIEALTEDDLIKAADRLSLTLLGIMK